MIMLVKTVIGNNQYIVRFVGLKNGNIDKNIMREMSLVLDEYNNLYGGLK